jgi:hypothetical protein
MSVYDMIIKTVLEAQLHNFISLKKFQVNLIFNLET